jgi:hypothetical protein
MPRQPPSRLVVDQRSGNPVSEHTGRRPHGLSLLPDSHAALTLVPVGTVTWR